MRKGVLLSAIVVLILFGASFTPISGREVHPNDRPVEKKSFREIEEIHDIKVADVHIYWTYVGKYPAIEKVNIESYDKPYCFNVTLKEDEYLHLILVPIVTVHSHLPEGSLERIKAGTPILSKETSGTFLYLLLEIIGYLCPPLAKLIQDLTKGSCTVWLFADGEGDPLYLNYSLQPQIPKHLCVAVDFHRLHFDSLDILLQYKVCVYAGFVANPNLRPLRCRIGSVPIHIDNTQNSTQKEKFADSLISSEGSSSEKGIVHKTVRCGNVTVSWKNIIQPKIDVDVPSELTLNVNLTNETEYVHFIYLVNTILTPPTPKILPTIALYYIKTKETGDTYIATEQSMHVLTLSHTISAEKGRTMTWKVRVGAFAFPLFAHSEKTIHLTVHFA